MLLFYSSLKMIKIELVIQLVISNDSCSKNLLVVNIPHWHMSQIFTLYYVSQKKNHTYKKIM